MSICYGEIKQIREY